MEYITGLLSNNGFIMYNKTIAKELGVTEAVLIGEFCAKYQYWLENGALIQNDGWFFVTREDIFLDTGLTDNQQRSALQTLKDNGIVEAKRKGVPSKMWYRLIVEGLHDLLSKKYIASGLKSRGLDIGKVDEITKKELTKKETKKEYTPLPPRGKTKSDESFFNCREILESSDLPADEKEKLGEWLQHKRERKDKYTETGFKALLTEYRNNAKRFGKEAVFRAIDQSMAGGYAGVVWDRLKEKNQKPFADKAEKTFAEIVAEMEGRHDSF